MRTFCVAGHRFSIELPERYGSSTALEPYLPFEDHTDGHRIFTLHVGDARECSHGSPSPARRFNEEAPYIWVCENDDMPVFGFSISPDEPDFRTINRFRSERLSDGRFDEVFRQVVLLLNGEGLVSLKVQYIDGTKIESVANRYTFVWKGSVEKNKEKLEAKVDAVLRTAEDVLAHNLRKYSAMLSGRTAAQSPAFASA